jgi:hypothetical protein
MSCHKQCFSQSLKDVLILKKLFENLQQRNSDCAYTAGKQYIPCYLFITVFLFYLWFCALSFTQIVKELEYKMGHYEEGKMNLHEYQGMNEAELGAEYYLKGGGFAPISDYSHRYNEKIVNENLNTRHNVGSYYSNVMAKPVY